MFVCYTLQRYKENCILQTKFVKNCKYNSKKYDHTNKTEKMETRKDYVNRVYNEACARGLCRRQKEFAALLGMDASTISSALNGNERYLTDNLIRRVQAWESQILRDGARPAPAAQQEGIFIPAETAALYNNMSETIRIQAEIISRLQAGASAPAGAYYAPKNRVEGMK